MRVSVALIVFVLFWPCIGVAEENIDSPAMKIDHLYTGGEFTNISGGVIVSFPSQKGHFSPGASSSFSTLELNWSGRRALSVAIITHLHTTGSRLNSGITFSF